MTRRLRGISLVELLGLLAIGATLVWMLPFSFRDFAVLLFLEAALVALAVVAAVARGRRGFSIESIPAAIGLVPILAMAPSVFPTHFLRLDAARYQDAELATVLTGIAAAKQDFPIWRFRIADCPLAHARLTVEIPQGCRLGDALDRVAAAAGCDYDWCWHKMCGNEPSPLCAIFRFRSRAAKAAPSTDNAVIVDRYGISEPD